MILFSTINQRVLSEVPDDGEFEVDLFVHRGGSEAGTECYPSVGAIEGSLFARLNLGAPYSATRYAPILMEADVESLIGAAATSA